MALTAKEVAEQLGISQATLSLVVNRKPGISQKTREKVIRDLQDYGYDYLLREETGEEAVSAASPKRNIGFVIYRRTGELLGEDSFFPLIMDQLEKRARRYSYNLSYITINRKSVDAEIGYIQEAECRGYVIFATEMKAEDLEPFQRLGIPFVIFDNSFRTAVSNTVKVNNEQGSYLAAEYLYRKGQRRVGYLSSGLDINSFHERENFAVKALKEFGISDGEDPVLRIGYSVENACLGMRRLLEAKREWPTAFLSDNDLVAAGAIKALREKGFRVPEDVSVIGFDDRPACLMAEPALTTMRLPRDAFGTEAVDLLLRVLEGDMKSAVQVQINCELVERDSVSVAGR